MSKAFLLFSIGILLPQLADRPCAPPSLSDLSLTNWSVNVATLSDRGPIGHGLIVSWSDGRAWIAVPAHVLRSGEQTQVAISPTLEIRLSGDTSPRTLCPNDRNFVNTRFPQFGVDLIFVCVSWIDRPYFWNALVASSTQAQDPVALLPVSSQMRGRVTNVPAIVNTGGVSFIETGLSGVEGLSGAPVGSARGVIGLYLGVGSNNVASARGRVLPIWDVQRLAEKSDVPWQLTAAEYFDCSRNRQVCIDAASRTKPQSVSLRASGSNTATTIEVGRCGSLPENKYGLDYLPADVTCEPTVLSVFAAAGPLRPTINCAPNLMGTWIADNNDQLQCTQIGLGEATCGGLGRLGFGVFDGRLRSAGGSEFVLEGRFIDGAGNGTTATGKLLWTNGRLTGEIQRVGYEARPLSLRRRAD